MSCVVATNAAAAAVVVVLFERIVVRTSNVLHHGRRVVPLSSPWFVVVNCDVSRVCAFAHQGKNKIEFE